MAEIAVHQESFLLLPKRRFEIGNRLKLTWLDSDRLSPTFGQPVWESGLVVGYCWQFTEWTTSEFQTGWSYWIRFDCCDQSREFFEPYTDFAHESQLTIARKLE